MGQVCFSPICSIDGLSNWSVQTLIKKYTQFLIESLCQVNYPSNEIWSGGSSKQHPPQWIRRFKRTKWRSFSLFLDLRLFLRISTKKLVFYCISFSQNMTLNEVGLDWQSEYEKQRERSRRAAYDILSLFVLFLPPKQAFIFSFEHFQTWVQLWSFRILVGSIVSCSFHFEGISSKMQPKNIQVYLRLAKIILPDVDHVNHTFRRFSLKYFRTVKKKKSRCSNRIQILVLPR